MWCPVWELLGHQLVVPQSTEHSCTRPSSSTPGSCREKRKHVSAQILVGEHARQRQAPEPSGRNSLNGHPGSTGERNVVHPHSRHQWTGAALCTGRLLEGLPRDQGPEAWDVPCMATGPSPVWRGRGRSTWMLSGPAEPVQAGRCLGVFRWRSVEAGYFLVLMGHPHSLPMPAGPVLMHREVGACV